MAGLMFLLLKKEKENSSGKFFSQELSHSMKQEMIRKNIWSPRCPVAIDRLRMLNISYIDFEGNSNHDGKIMVHDVVVDAVLKIFQELYDRRFPISSINLINKYDGDDEISMEHNNSSSFACRRTPNSKMLSLHSYGLAIDINPQQNPYLVTQYEMGKNSIPIFPSLGMEYINRKNIRAGMVETTFDNNYSVVDIFYKYGFTIWVGKWNDPIDWHHFQLTREQAEIIAKLPYNEGLQFFNKTVLNLQSG
jgi:hypothetical protein